MKKILFSFILIGLALSISSASAATEGVLMDQISSRNTEGKTLPNPFTMIVTGNGRLIAKPGAVFTEGWEEPGTTLPYLLGHPKPISYPHWVVSKGWQGKLIIAVEIRTDGTIGLYQVMHSTGYKALDKRAVHTIQNWKFHPAMKDGKPVKTCIQIPILFQLKGE